jgi:hypothetical protein
MSTTNSPSFDGLGARDVAGAASPALFGLPDAATVAQLANALFAALPGRATVPAIAADAQAAPPTSALPVAPPAGPEGEFASLPVAPYVSPTSGFSPPGEADLRPVPASLASVGGLAHPATAATPPPESLPYFLDPAQPGLPGTAVGLAPSSATRLEAGAMPTAPSPPSAFAQPAEPNLRSVPVASGLASTLPGNAPASGPYSFRPELVAAPTETTPAGSPASAVSSPALPQPASSPTPALATTPAVEAEPSGYAGAIPAASPPGASFYFLEEASNPFLDAAVAHIEGPFDPFGFPAVVSALEFGAYPFDSRASNATPEAYSVTGLA